VIATLALLGAVVGAAIVVTETPVVAVAEGPAAVGVELRALRTRHLRRGETVELVAVLVSPDGRGCRVAGALAGARFEGQACTALPAEAEARLRWFEARPEARDYDNVRRCHGRPRQDCVDPIVYRFDEIPHWRGRARVQGGATAGGLGSHRYAASLDGPPPVASDAARVQAELVLRRDDSYVGYLTELIGTPFVLWPTASEVDERRGADCVALVIYGQRRLGHRVRYVSPGGLKKLTTRVAGGRFPRDPSQELRSHPAVRVGDIVHFGFQTAVVVEDRPPLGRLTPADVVIHSYHGLAEEVPLGDVPYAHFPFEVRRWPTD
jgi:hypothetical protein